MTTEAEFTFRAVMDSPEGTSTSRSFPNRKAADSFRTRLYRAKSKLNDFSVEISVDGCEVLLKKTKYITVKLISPEGNEVDYSINNLKEKDWQRIEKEIIDECRSLKQSQLLIDDLLRIRREEFESTGR